MLSEAVYEILFILARVWDKKKSELPTSSRSQTCGFRKTDALPQKERELVSELRPTLDSPVASVLRIVRISNDNSVMRINSKRMMINFELGPQLLIVCGGIIVHDTIC